MPASTTMASSLPPPTWTPSSDRGVRVDLRRAVIPASLGVLVVLAFGFRAPWTVLVPASAIVPAGYALAFWYLHRNLKPFEARFNARLTSGDVDGLWVIYRDARLLRLLAPRWIMLSKLGLILSLRGDHRAANRVLEEAYDLSPRSRRADLLGPLARTKYALGEIDALKQIALQWRSRALFPGAASVYLAAAYLDDPREDSEQARALLDEVGAGLGSDAAELRERLLERLP